MTRQIIKTRSREVSHKEKVCLLSESAALLLPSLVEGFGIVILEASACSRPAVVADVMPLPDLVSNGDDGLVLHPFDHDAWARSLTALALDPELIKAMGRRARTKLHTSYTIERVVNMLQDLYLGASSAP